jgi:peptide methionine sulfoxide reductase MsrB
VLCILVSLQYAKTLGSNKQSKHGYFYKFNNPPPGNYFGSKNKTYSGKRRLIVALECGSRRGHVFQNNPKILLLFSVRFTLT